MIWKVNKQRADYYRTDFYSQHLKSMGLIHAQLVLDSMGKMYKMNRETMTAWATFLSTGFNISYSPTVAVYKHSQGSQCGFPV